MTYWEKIKMSFQSIVANKTRSFLTMLGIIIGIASVVAILSIGNGVTTDVSDTFTELGNTSISISMEKKADSSDQITLTDLEVLKENIPYIKYISPNTSLSVVGETSSKESNLIMIAGTPDTQYTNSIMDKELVQGRYFNQLDYDSGDNVVVISQETANYFFGDQKDVIGKSITLKSNEGSLNVKVIGVSKGNINSVLEEDEDTIAKYIAMPITSIRNLQSNSRKFSDITVIVHEQDQIQTASQQIINILNTRHNVSNKNVYKAKNYLQMFEQINGILDLFVQFIAAVAAIALVVGGIGVMNIMLVSVTERTKEIGIRKSLGATNKDIQDQFLIESLILCLLGGIIGVILGIISTILFTSLLGVGVFISIKTIIFVLFFSCMIGLFFGVYPAKKAAKLNPIDALRHE